MKTSDFYYDLPEELIAQTPVEPRNSSRLMVLPRNGGKIEHKHFYDLPEFLKPGDALCLITPAFYRRALRHAGGHGRGS